MVAAHDRKVIPHLAGPLKRGNPYPQSMTSPTRPHLLKFTLRTKSSTPGPLKDTLKPNNSKFCARISGNNSISTKNGDIVCHPNTQEAEAGGLWIQGQVVLHMEKLKQ